MAAPELKDPSLQRGQRFIAGVWLDADQDQALDVGNGINKGMISSEDEYLKIKNMCMGIS